MKKFITVLIAICLLCSLLPFGAFAAEYTCRDVKELQTLYDKCEEACEDAQRNYDDCKLVYDSAEQQLAADQENVKSAKTQMEADQKIANLLSVSIGKAKTAYDEYLSAKEEYESIPFINYTSKKSAESKMKNAKSKYEDSLCGYESIEEMESVLSTANAAVESDRAKLNEAEKFLAADQQTFNSVKISLDASKVQLSLMQSELNLAGSRLENAKATHNTRILNTKEATCTEAGYTGDKVCQDCGETIEKGKATNPLGHSYKNGVCIRCGAKPTNNPFVDVKAGSYCEQPVLWAYYHNPQITCGIDKTHFAPDAGCTRAQIVTFLWRAMGCPEPNSKNCRFIDVASSGYYYKAVLWAVEKDITKGVDDTHFAPDTTCTRAQAVTFLWRAKNSPVVLQISSPFVDVSPTAYYYSAMVWAVEKEITYGTDSTHFQPNAICTRGQIVTFMYRDMK